MINVIPIMQNVVFILVIAGLGIKFAIVDAQKIFYISFNPLMDEYIKKLNPSAESLNDLYENMPDRQATYIAMKDRVVNAVTRDKQKVCFVSYEHPYVLYALKIVILASGRLYIA